MFKVTAPVLYFSPKIINQIQINNDGGLVTSRTNIERTNLKASIKVLVDTLFVPLIGGEGNNEYGRTKEMQIDKQYDDLSRAVKTIREAQNERMLWESGHNISNDTLIYVEGIFKLQKIMINKEFFVSITFPFGEYTVQGLTSIENWVAKSLIHQLLMHGEVTASAIVFPLSITGKNIQAKIVCIFIM